MNIKVGDTLVIHCYKHNGHLHRQWDEAVLLDIKDDYMVFGNNKTTVMESVGRIQQLPLNTTIKLQNKFVVLDEKCPTRPTNCTSQSIWGCIIS